jgi:streptogramin lyase
VYPVQSISAVNEYGLDSLTVALPQPPGAGVLEADVLVPNTPSLSSALLDFGAQPIKGQAVDGSRAMAVDGSGNIYWEDQAGKVVNRITPLGASSTVYTAQTTSVTGMAVNQAGTLLYVNDGGAIVRISLADGTSSVITRNTGGAWGIALDEAHNAVYIAENGAGRIGRLDLTSGTVTTVAGTGKKSATCDRGSGVPALQADLGTPIALAVGPDGSIYFGDDTAFCLEKIAPDGTLTTIAGNGSNGKTADGAPAAGSPIGLARGVTVDGSGSVMFAESLNHLVRGIDSSGNLATVIDGLSGPFAAQLDPLGYYYLLDIGAKTITRYPPGPNSSHGSLIATRSN